MKKTPEDIIKAELQADEKLLWSHVMSYDEPTPKTAKKSRLFIFISQWLNPIMMLIFGGYVIWPMRGLSSEEVVSLLKHQIPLFIFIMGLMFVLHKTNIFQKLEDNGKYIIYGSCIITDRRILLFNHHESERVEYREEDIADVRLNYDNGGKALRFKPWEKALNADVKDSLLVGIADFEAALAVLRPYRMKA